MRRAAAVLLIGSFGLSVIGAILYTRRTSGGTDVFGWERGILIAGYIVAAAGVAVLLRRPPAGEAMVSRLATAIFWLAAAVAVVAEAWSVVEGSSTMSGSSMMSRPWVWSVTVVLLFAAGAMLGFALLKSGLAPSWVAWMVMVWNVACLVVLWIVTPTDMYFPVLHFLPLLVVGISVAVSKVESGRDR
jgi:hypothetical protein